DLQADWPLQAFTPAHFTLPVSAALAVVIAAVENSIAAAAARATVDILRGLIRVLLEASESGLACRDRPTGTLMAGAPTIPHWDRTCSGSAGPSCRPGRRTSGLTAADSTSPPRDRHPRLSRQADIHGNNTEGALFWMQQSSRRRSRRFRIRHPPQRRQNQVSRRRVSASAEEN